MSNTKYLIRGLDYYTIARICYDRITKNKMDIQTSEYGGLQILPPDNDQITFLFHKSCLLPILGGITIYVQHGLSLKLKRLIFTPEDIEIIHQALFDLVASKNSIFYNLWKELPEPKETFIGTEAYLTYEDLEEAVIFSSVLK